jgi:hypothetical protein
MTPRTGQFLDVLVSALHPDLPPVAATPTA